MTAAILFPGQGSQFVGMLDAVLQRPCSSPATTQHLHRLVEEVDEILGFSLSRLIREGPLELLIQTRYTQPALYLTSIAHWKYWQLEREAKGQTFNIQLAMGHSVGEFAALHTAGFLTFKQGLLLTV